MKNKYIKNVFNILKWPIMFIIGQFFIRYIFVSAFNNNVKGNRTTEEFLEYMNTSIYKISLNEYLNNNILLMISILSIIFIPILYKVYKKYKVKSDFKISNIFIPIVLGITISLIYNIVLFNLNNVFEFTDKFQISEIPIFIQVITSGILGPIMEELIFRGIVYNRLKTRMNPMRAIILTSLIFGLLHGNIIDSIYAFGVSFILIYLYEKDKTIISPMIMHISLNTTIILMLNIIIQNYVVLNYYLLIASIIILLIIRNRIIKRS